MPRIKDLLYTNQNCYEVWKPKKIQEAYALSDDYKLFLDKGKTERMMVSEAVKVLEKSGFIPLEKIKRNTSLSGQKAYVVNREKSLVAVIYGKAPINMGFNIIVSHIDSSRIDLKVNPLYEDSGIGFFKTHYYGGIKKYQWPTIPLSLHGVVVLKNGKKVDIHIGEEKDDPIFVITDLLPHAAGKQMEKKASDVVMGEEMNIIIGSVPAQDKKVKERIKQAIMEQLHDQYGMIEEDFQSAEIEAVPAFETRDIGFDRSFIGGYGHDDRASSYTALRALIDIKKIPEKTIVLYWSDKEEIGSYGSTGAQSNFFYHAVGNIIRCCDEDVFDTQVRDILSNSQGLSADVDVAFDPDYKEFHDVRNTALMNHGVVITKYTGVRGKYGGNDADAEYMGKVRQLFNDHHVVWQTGLISKVDVGGGGTIALFLAALGIHIVDCGPAVLSMHSPYEIVSKVDLFSAYEAYKTFFERMK